MKEKTTEAIEALLNAMNEEVPMDDETRKSLKDALIEGCETMIMGIKVLNVLKEE